MLELSGLVKRFGNTTALSGLDLRAEVGEIVGIAGPNGAGKSTLIHVLAGEIPEDEGTVTLDGQQISFADRPRSVSVVHQELQLFPTLTVLENLLVGSDENRFLRPRPSAAVRAVAQEFGLLSVADRPLDSCSIVVQQLTEIARAILHRKRVVLLDEPNSALTSADSDRLFGEILRLKAQGRTIVLLVSHRLADLERYCDRVLVVREGAAASELRGSSLNTTMIAQAIVGTLAEVRASAAFDVAPSARTPGAVNNGPEASVTRAHRAVRHRMTGSSVADDAPSSVVEVQGWSDRRGAAFRDVDLRVSKGEALFLTGQEDGGGRELLRSLAGLRGATGQIIALPGAAAGSVCYLPGNRASSLFANLSVRANLCIRLRDRAIGGRAGLLRTDLMNETATELVARLDILTSSLNAPIGSLSGGTQQKVAIGSAFAGQPRMLILEDPTRGVDVKTRQQIVQSLRDFVAEGNAILGFSPELDEVFELADVVRVAVKGRLSPAMRLVPGQSLEGLARWVDRMNQNGGDHPLDPPIEQKEHVNGWS